MQITDIFADLPVLETVRTRLRKMTYADAEDIFHYASDEAVSKYTTWFAHQTMADTNMFIEANIHKYDNHEVAPWAIEDKQSGTMIGTAGFVYWNTKHARTELAYALARPYWNKGYMTEIARTLVQFAFENMNVVRVEARCHPDNIGSARVMEKAGLTFEGILRKQLYAKGQYQDVKMYAIVDNDA